MNYFRPRKNKRERHNKLGTKKNEFYKINKKSLSTHLKIFEGKELNKKNILLNLHLAYSHASKEDLKKKKIIIINLHSLEFLKDIDEFNYKILYTIRDPLISLSSGFKHWLDYKRGTLASPWSIFFFFFSY